MIEFNYPWLFLLLLLPFIVHHFVPAYRTKQSALQVPFFDVLVDVIGLKASKGATELKSSFWQKTSLVLGWLLLVFAMAKPVWLGEPQTREVAGRDLMIVVDLSGSMETNDFVTSNGEKLSRLDAAKNVLVDFSEQRQGDRLGLILFGDSAFLQAPFTADHHTWNELLLETRVAMAGQSTHLGDAIGLGIKVFREEDKVASRANQDSVATKQKVLIVLTDGNDTDSLVPPIEAAKIAALYDIRIHMVAMGNPQTVGENAMDMEVVEQVAKLTGGESFVALSPSQLSLIYKSISELEPALFESFTYQPKVPIHYVPLLLLLLNYLFMMMFYGFKRSRNKKTLLAQGEAE